MYDIISLALDFIAIGISIYALFKDGKAKDTEKSPQFKVLKQIVLIQQINPNYNIHNEFNVPSDYSDRIAQNRDEIKNANWVSKRLFQLAIILIYVSLALNFISYFHDSQGIDSLISLTAMVYLPMKNTLFQLSLCLIAFCVVIILKGWDKSQSKLSNLWAMKYYSLKISSELLTIIGLSFISYSFIEKVNTNIQNPVYSWSVFALAILFLVQILWIQFTIQKLTKISTPATNYEDKEKQILMYIPAYIAPLIFFVLIVYTKFF